MDNRPIGIFDSGIGGLTVVDSISKSLPHESIHYVGDTARVPYGNKSMERVQQFSKEITQWLVNHECKIIIIACNTASSLALDFLRSEFDIPIIGVIQPGVEATLKITMNNRVGVLGTHATIRSGNYVKMLKNMIQLFPSSVRLVHFLFHWWKRDGSVETFRKILQKLTLKKSCYRVWIR